MLNENLTKDALKEHDKAAFAKDPVIVTLPPEFRLFKLSGHSPVNSEGKLSHWWSPVFPYLEDQLGAIGRYKEAQANEVTMREMVRFAAAVSLDWNDLANYLEVVTSDHIQCFWGPHSPQPMLSESGDPKKWQDALNLADQRGVYVPDTLGGIDAWQFCIPNLTTKFVKEDKVTIPAHDMAALAVHLGIGG
jgi:hypothetical protein